VVRIVHAYGLYASGTGAVVGAVVVAEMEGSVRVSALRDRFGVSAYLHQQLVLAMFFGAETTRMRTMCSVRAGVVRNPSSPHCCDDVPSLGVAD
jgi:hypothetical protein